MASIRKRAWSTAAGEQKTAWVVDFADSCGGRQRRQFRTKKEADAFRIEAEGQLRAGVYRAEAAKVTIAELSARYLEHCEGRMRRGERMTRRTLDAYRGHIRNYIAPDQNHAARAKFARNLKPFKSGVGALRISQLSRRGVSDFRDRLRDAGVSVATTRKILITLKLMFEHAIGRDLASTNPARGVRVIGRRGEKSKRVTPPSKEDVRRLIAVADADFSVMLVFAITVGVRASELYALRWRHIDFEAGEVAIETRVDAYGEEDVTKSEAGMRTVPISAGVLTILKAWRLRSKWAKDDDLAFPNSRGRYWSHSNLRKSRLIPLFERLEAQHFSDPARHAPAPERFGWHALRHFAISCWIEQNLAPKTIQTFAGHSSISVTMDRYGHLFKSEDHHRAMDAIAEEILC